MVERPAEPVVALHPPAGREADQAAQGVPEEPVGLEHLAELEQPELLEELEVGIGNCFTMFLYETRRGFSHTL